MSIIPSQTLNEMFQAGMEAPGYWAWVFDEPEHVYSSQNEEPTHTPTGHWEWIPSAKELFHQEVAKRSITASLFAREPKEHSLSKGDRIPTALLKPIDDPE